MARKKSEDTPAPGAPRYLTTYGDMMTQIVVFFVLLLSFSSMKQEQFNRAMGSMQGAFGVLPYDPALIIPNVVPIPELTNLQESEIEQSIVKLEDILSEQQLKESVRLQVGDKGISIVIDDVVMFAPGNAELKPKAYPILTRVAALARGWPNTIRVEGHTDSDPIKTAQFPSNWELSSARAMSVLHFFQDDAGFEPRNLTAIGKGEYHPIIPNDTPENKAKNRRIEIYIDYNSEVRPPVGTISGVR
jgi:chemotaxis protein MotB